jgi:predicted TIM-barrel fold metal-dependent hydrolase
MILRRRVCPPGRARHVTDKGCKRHVGAGVSGAAPRSTIASRRRTGFSTGVEADCLEFAVKTLGADNILYGTDCPWNIGNLEPAKEIPGLSRLAAEDQEKILSGNGQRL